MRGTADCCIISAMKKSLFAMVAAVLAAAASEQPAAEPKVQAANPKPRDVPELMVTKAGDKVTDIHDWQKQIMEEGVPERMTF